ncbi:hypothetical protein [Streptomyces roseochromogenus]|uniref:hypothetical protein n=1 Tax=Streptomyces roseochromogenus TaxID=285450 RepID=UPI000AE0EF81|nr:hypothetical protein [Streptomyces roseochromogenus]
MAQLALGTYRCRVIPEATVRAAASAAQQGIATAPDYATGHVETLLTPALAAHPALRVDTKAGCFTAATGTDAVNASPGWGQGAGRARHCLGLPAPADRPQPRAAGPAPAAQP